MKMPWYSKFYDSTGLVEVGGVNLPACSWFGAPPDDLMEKIKTDMSAAEQSGDLVDLFKCRCKGPELTDRQKFKGTIKPDMKLTKRTFLNILAYDLSTSGYAEDMLARMELLGCTNARAYYAGVKAEWEYNHEKGMKNVTEWYRRKSKEEDEELKRKEVNESRKQEKQQEAELLKADLHQKSDRELLILLQNMK